MKAQTTVNNNLEQAINTILPVVATLTDMEWARISGIIKNAYSMKAAKTMLDGSDMENLNISLRHELLDEPYSKLVIKKQALGDKEKELDTDKIAKKMCELLAGAQDTYNPVKDTKPASFPKIRVGDVACPLPAVVTLSLSEAEEMVHENKDELLARQRNDRKGIEYHLS